MMPEEFTLEFNRFHVAVVYFTKDVRFVVFGNERKLLLEIDGVHVGGLLEILNDGGDGGEHPAGGIAARSFGIHAE